MGFNRSAWGNMSSDVRRALLAARARGWIAHNPFAGVAGVA
ncbi:hypothetical protein [Sphingopyxis sp. H050]|jgi:hypothetical protein|nr:hypothetical protein [Sphingopyxis sp. H050]